jgi:hypothetical protein
MERMMALLRKQIKQERLEDLELIKMAQYLKLMKLLIKLKVVLLDILIDKQEYHTADKLLLMKINLKNLKRLIHILNIYLIYLKMYVLKDGKIKKI